MAAFKFGDTNKLQVDFLNVISLYTHLQLGIFCSQNAVAYSSRQQASQLKNWQSRTLQLFSRDKVLLLY